MEEVISQIRELHGWEAMEVAKAAAQQLDDQQHLDFRLWNSNEEPKRREKKASKAAGAIEMLQELRAEGVIETPVAEAEDPSGYTDWVDPGTIHSKMYLTGDRVLHDATVWESLVDLNHWEPSPEAHAAWMDITTMLFPPAEGGVLAYADSTHYTAGDRVTFDGIVYECAADHYAAPGWTPLNAHGYWSQVE